MAKRVSSFILTIIMLVSLIPATVAAADDDRNGWVKEDGAWYYYQDDARVTGWLKTGGKWYYLSAEYAGRMVDWPSECIKGKWYVFNSDGSLVSKAGWITQKRNDYSFKYYVRSDGTAYAINSWKKIGGKWYYFVDTGYVITEAWVPNGIEINGRMSYFNKDGSWKHNCWHSYEGKWYYLNSDGEPVSGWKKINKKWYFFGEGNAMLSDKWYRTPNTNDWYYFDKSGAMVVNKWAQDGGGWFYQGSDGASVTGWKKLDGKWYYLDPNSDGRCVVDSKGYKIDGKKYDFDKNGVCITPKGY